MSAERPELGAGRVFKVFGMAGEGLGSRDMPRQRSILWQEEGFPPRLCGTSGLGTSDNWFKRESEPTLGCGYNPGVRRHHF